MSKKAKYEVKEKFITFDSPHFWLILLILVSMLLAGANLQLYVLAVAALISVVLWLRQQGELENKTYFRANQISKKEYDQNVKLEK